MVRSIAGALSLLLILSGIAGRAEAQRTTSPEELAQVRHAIASAFEFLYDLPRDTGGAAMGSWVLDTAATTVLADSVDRWRIAVTRLTDTGDALNVEEMTGKAGESPAELAAAMRAMQQLEAKVSKSEAEASLDVEVTFNGADLGQPRRLPDNPGPRLHDVVAGATTSWLARGHWITIDDRELGMTLERWVPAELSVRFAARGPGAMHALTVTARGSDEMIERLVKETRWNQFAALLK